MKNEEFFAVRIKHPPSPLRKGDMKKKAEAIKLQPFLCYSFLLFSAS